MKKTLIALVFLSMLIALPLVSAFQETSIKRSFVKNSFKLSKEELETKVEEFKGKIPIDFEATEELMPIQRHRYLLWTRDGQHIMWGWFGKTYFTGTDDQGNHAWGIYGNNIFAGLYDGEFFWGKYGRGRWKAEGLFGEEHSSGRYVTFRRPIALEARSLE